MKKTIIEVLYEKQANCIENARNCETEWSRNFWKETAEKIGKKIDSLKLVEIIG